MNLDSDFTLPDKPYGRSVEETQQALDTSTEGLSPEQAVAGILSTNARLLQQGRWTEIEADQLVPGDIVALKSGNRVPADLRLSEVVNQRIEKSAMPRSTRIYCLDASVFVCLLTDDKRMAKLESGGF